MSPFRNLYAYIADVVDRPGSPNEMLSKAVYNPLYSLWLHITELEVILSESTRMTYSASYRMKGCDVIQANKKAMFYKQLERDIRVTMA